MYALTQKFYMQKFILKENKHDLCKYFKAMMFIKSSLLSQRFEKIK